MAAWYNMAKLSKWTDTDMPNLNRLLVAITALLLLFVSALPAAAQNNPTASGLSISPTLFELSVRPGEASKIDIRLKNITVNKIIAQAAINDFESDNASGNPKLITDPAKISPYTIRHFVQGLEDVPLEVSQQKTITLPIQIPADTSPGGYFGVIRYKAVPAGPNAPKPGEVALSASVGAIVLITVPGNVREQVQLSGLHIYRGGYDGTLFVRKPTHIGVEIRNLGNGFARPYGTVEVKNMSGKAVYSYQLNSANPRANVLPSSTRIFKDQIKNVSSPGRYTVTASVSYGSGSQVLALKQTFWYIPLWLVILIVVILLLLVLLAFGAYRRYRRDSRRAYKRKG
jgi:hypothetical protein